MTVALILQGAALTKVGHAAPFMVVGGALGAVSAGLFYTFDSDTSIGKWVGYQILCGLAVGATFQVSMAIVQVKAAPEDISSLTAMIICKLLPTAVCYVRQRGEER